MRGSWLGRALCLLAAAAPQVAWHLQPLPAGLRVFQVAALLIAAIRPPAGLVLLAGAAPLTTSIAAALGSPQAGSRLLEQLVLGCVTGALIHLHPGAQRTRLLWPAVIVATAAIASAAAELPARVLSLATGASGEELVQSWLASYFGHPPLWEPIFYGVLAAEGAALAWAAERIVRNHPAVIGPALAAALLGHVSAAWFNIDRLLTASLRSEQPISRLRELLSTVRFSIQYDKNAAGGVYAMVFFVGMMFAADASRWRRAAAWSSMAILAVAVVITGSRMAMLAIALGLFARLVLSAFRRPWVWALVCATVVLAGAGAYALSGFYGERNVETAVSGRQLLASAALRMTATAPWFGIGVGTFFERSFEFGGEEMIVLVGSANPRENAHNNFLQVLAEQGLTGLAAWLVLLGAGLAPAAARLRSSSFRQQSLIIGLLAFLVTWLTGHPMLVPEAAFMFWLLFGMMAGGLPPASDRAWTRTAGLLAGATMLLALSLPIRVGAERQAADLEHRGIGVSAWQHEGDMRYRMAGSTFGLYLPTDAAGVLVPVRLAPDSPDRVRLDVRVGDRLINSVTVAGSDWLQLRLRLPESPDRFLRVDFVVSGDAGAPLPDPVLHVGRARPLSPAEPAD
jgi:hypothetical protein